MQEWKDVLGVHYERLSKSWSNLWADINIQFVLANVLSDPSLFIRFKSIIFS